MITADLAIIGGGLAGVSLAYFLSQQGWEDVILVERDQLGCGSTAGSFGGVRQQFSTRLEIELAKRGLTFWKTFEETIGHPCPFNRHGYLLLASSEDTATALRRAADLQRDCGAPGVEILEPSQLASRFPWINPERLTVASWTPGDGSVTASDGLSGLVRVARSNGVRFIERHAVSGIVRQGRGFELKGSASVSCRSVVVAANYDSPGLLEQFNVDLAIRSMVVYSALLGAFVEGAEIPMTIDLDGGLYLAPEGPGALAGVVPAQGNFFRNGVEMLEALEPAAQARAPIVAEQPIIKVISAVEEVGGDGHPYAGAVDDGLWVLAGFSGHGVTHGPPVAELLAKQITGIVVDDTLDITSLSPHRSVDVGGRDEEWLLLAERAGSGEGSR